MPINQLYSSYFQKSKGFLLPALGIRKSRQTTELMTFIGWSGHYTFDNHKLIVCKSHVDSPEFRQFEKMYLFPNIYFEDCKQVDHATMAYIYDLSSFKEDWTHFLNGKYSMFSDNLKSKIKEYYGETTAEWEYVKSFLYPQKYFRKYATLLFDPKEFDSGLEQLEVVGELAAPYDPELETLSIKQNSFEKI